MFVPKIAVKVAKYVLALAVVAVVVVVTPYGPAAVGTVGAGPQVNQHYHDNLVVTKLETRTCKLLGSPGCGPAEDWYKVDKPLGYTRGGKRSSIWANQYVFVEKKPVKKLTADDTVLTGFTIDAHGAISCDVEKYNQEAPEDRYFYNVDVLYGADAVDPRLNWELHKEASLAHGEVPAYLTLRKTLHTHLVHPELVLDDLTSSFKILQVADLHFSTLEGECRDQFPAVDNCKADARSLKFINEVVDIESPDLVVLTGDQIFGENSFDSITTILKVVSVFIEYKIPYAVMLGNHDDEGSLKARELMEFIETLPYSLTKLGPTEIDGVGNYILRVKHTDSRKDIISLYILDSHKKHRNPKMEPGYDWIKENQLEYLANEYNSNIKPNQHPKHLSFGFFHIPLPEFTNVPNQYMKGTLKEGITAPRYNSFARDALSRIGVSIVGVGHDHCNDYCLLDQKEGEQDMWLCYGGGSGEGGYAAYGGTTRRLRIYEVLVDHQQVRTYKRLESTPNEIFDEQTLIKNGEFLTN